MSIRVLILGANGMLGHKLWQLYRNQFDTWTTLRSWPESYAQGELFDPQRTLVGVDAFDFDTVTAALAATQPDVVINCIGIVKQAAAAEDPITCLTINALFPHRLAALCRADRMRLIHVSTDCVFSGRKAGLYRESDISDAEDLYGRTKFLGEITKRGCLTLRTSIIGRELDGRNGLIEWFLGNAGGTVRGYVNAIFSGLTTQSLAQVIAEVIRHHRPLSGLYHIAASPINKHELLRLVGDAFGLPITITPDPNVVVNRALDGRRFHEATGLATPDWPTMIQELAADPTPYSRWRNEQA